jgi:hypothetical protein
MTNYCLVCGYDLGIAPWEDSEPSHEICPSCGIHFGYDDMAGGKKEMRLYIYLGWRGKWKADDMKWWSKGQPQPENWNPKEQLKNIPEQFQ